MIWSYRLRQAGYTLTELLLVVAIITSIVSLGIPIYAAFNNTNSLDVTINSLVQDLYQAQLFSRSEKLNSAWGVAINGQSIVLYAGSSYAGRNSAYDTIFNMPTTTSASGLNEVDFSKLYGLTTNTGTFTLKSGANSRTVTVNAKGEVDY